MYVHSVKLINYKSIGDYTESEIIIEPRVTAIVSKPDLHIKQTSPAFS